MPGGTAAYPSSVLMNAIRPASRGGRDHHGYAAPEKRRFQSRCHGGGLYRGGGCGLSRRRCPGRRGLAYGTASVPRVDKIVGPGNIYVATAKRLVYGQVDIDMVAGPSEILVLADASADPRYLAADLMSQAEHDALASSILLTDSAEIAERTLAELESRCRRCRARRSSAVRWPITAPSSSAAIWRRRWRLPTVWRPNTSR